jgi:hypothetical protein
MSISFELHDRQLVFLDGPAGVLFELAEWTIRV